jgi:hypothetical protein
MVLRVFQLELFEGAPDPAAATLTLSQLQALLRKAGRTSSNPARPISVGSPAPERHGDRAADRRNPPRAWPEARHCRVR